MHNPWELGQAAADGGTQVFVGWGLGDHIHFLPLQEGGKRRGEAAHWRPESLRGLVLA